MNKSRKKRSPAPMTDSGGIKDFLDMIAPSVIDFKVDHFLCGNTYRCVWALREYPTSTDEQAILRHLGEMDGVTIRIYTRQVTASEEKRIIHNAANRNRMSRSSTEDPKLQKIILCLDHDAAGIEAAGRLTDILCKHGYTQSAPLRSTNKDWDEDLKEQHGLEPQPPEEHPQLIVAGTICERIGAKCKAVRPEQASYQIPRLLQQYQNDLHWGRFEQAMDHMETMSALALSVVLRECRQMGTVLTEEQGARFLQSHIHPHQNRGSLKTRATEIGMEFQSVLAKDAVEGIRTEVEKKATASAWLELAISCAKVPIKYCADELRRQQKEEKALLEAAQAMASY